MNQIIERCRVKRKYKRKPKCLNLGGICEWDKCRCDYPLKAPKSTQKIDEYLHHREKVIKRRREIELAKLDEENTNTPQNTIDSMMNYFNIQGEFAKRKAQLKKYKRMMYWGLSIIPIVAVLYVLAIMIIDIL